MLESTYQAKLIKKLDKLFPGCVILKNDSAYRQGIPDLTILYGSYWACLEVKASKNSDQQPNQEWYIDTLNSMWFAAFIFPENEREVLHDLQQAFRTRRSSRISKS